MNVYRKAIIASMTAALMAAGMLGAQGTMESQIPVDTVTPVAVEMSVQADSSIEDGVLLMREEEKLARDVYLTLYEKWNLRTFGNIAKAEQNHMDAVAYLMEIKGIADPVEYADVGVFTNEEIAGLYNTLVEKGSVSIVEAIKVGALIEDLDISDLEKLLANTTDEDTIRVYENLLAGSEQHMRAFINQLSRYNEKYEPAYISESRYNEILRSN